MLISLISLMALVALTALAASWASGRLTGGSSADTTTTARADARPRTSAVARHHRATTATAIDPLTTRSARAWIASREGDVTAAVLNLANVRQWVLHPAERAQTASIIKVEILETLLYRAERDASGLSGVETDAAQDMIEASNDNDATDLWDAIGGATAIAAYDNAAGLTQTTPNTEGYWGETMTSAADQIKVLKQLALAPGLLTREAQGYELGLMRRIDADQDWGVSGGVPAGVSVALKNGWVPLTSASDWEINSIGWIKGDGRDYLIAVLTKHDPSEGYGIATIQRLSADVYATLGRHQRGG